MTCHPQVIEPLDDRPITVDIIMSEGTGREGVSDHLIEGVRGDYMRGMYDDLGDLFAVSIRRITVCRPVCQIPVTSG